MTREFREVVSHKHEMGDGIRMLMAIVPATDEKEGCIVIKLQSQLDQNKWNSDTERVAYLSCADIGRLLMVLNGCKKGVMGLGVGDTKVSCIHMLMSNSEYKLDLYNANSMMCINLFIHEAEIFKEILRAAIFRVVFG